jgi:hypothetical protein
MMEGWKGWKGWWFGSRVRSASTAVFSVVGAGSTVCTAASVVGVAGSIFSAIATSASSAVASSRAARRRARPRDGPFLNGRSGQC